jgi:hypothetical protein
MKTSELIGSALDWAVAKCEGYTFRTVKGLTTIYKDGVYVGDWLPECREDWGYWAPSLHWAQGGPIIEREISKLFKNVGGTYTAQIRHEESHPLVAHKVLAGWTNCAGPTPLIAAMRCYVTAKLGEEVEIPEECP